jgi:hypothetical protein
MRVRSAVTLALTATVVAGSLIPAHAAKKKPPITKSYSLNLTPAPVEVPLQEGACESDKREAGVNLDVKTIKVTGPGKLSVDVTGFTGDWDTAVYNAGGVVLQEGVGTSFPDNMSSQAKEVSETIRYKSKKAQTLYLRVCNYFGAPTANVKYTYVYS